jgi:hypothetical protein
VVRPWQNNYLAPIRAAAARPESACYVGHDIRIAFRPAAESDLMRVYLSVGYGNFSGQPEGTQNESAQLNCDIAAEVW